MQFHEIHPGITLKEELEARGISPAAAALKLRVPPQRLHMQNMNSPETCEPGHTSHSWRALQFRLTEDARLNPGVPAMQDMPLQTS